MAVGTAVSPGSSSASTCSGERTLMCPAMVGLRLVGWSPGLHPRRGRPALGRGHQGERGGTVDRLAHYVGMAGVARRLLDEVQEHPADRPGVEVIGEPRDAL